MRRTVASCHRMTSCDASLLVLFVAAWWQCVLEWTLRFVHGTFLRPLVQADVQMKSVIESFKNSFKYFFTMITNWIKKMLQMWMTKLEAMVVVMWRYGQRFSLQALSLQH